MGSSLGVEGRNERCVACGHELDLTRRGGEGGGWFWRLNSVGRSFVGGALRARVGTVDRCGMRCVFFCPWLMEVSN